MILTRIWKKGTHSIIIEPFPPGKMDPPKEKTSCDMIQLDRSAHSAYRSDCIDSRYEEHGYTQGSEAVECRVGWEPARDNQPLPKDTLKQHLHDHTIADTIEHIE